MTSSPITPGAAAYHDTLADTWEARRRRKSHQRRAAALLSLLDDSQFVGKDWLDAGCGTGFLARLLAGRKCRVLGLDAAQRMIEVAKALAEQQPDLSAFLDFRLVPTIEKLDLPDASFDGVLCSSVLEYLENPEQCLKEFARVLRPGGALVISAPHRLSAIRALQAMALRLTRGRWPGYLQFSRNAYTFRDFRHLLEKSGLSVQRMYYYTPRLPPAVGACALLGTLLMARAARKQD